MPTPSVPPGNSRRATRACAALAALLTGVGLVVVLPSSASAAVPTAPTRVLAIASPGSARVGWFGPDSDGGAPITSYRITASTGAVFSVTQDPATVTGLANGVAVSFRVAAVNADGVGPNSAPSATVTPTVATSTNTWGPRAPLIAGRSGASAVRLQNDKVLVIAGDPGGFDAVQRRSAELFNPTTNTWSATGSLPEVRSAFTTTPLPNGRVLVAGGWTANFGVRASTRLYNPAAGTWSSGAPMLSPRVNATATLLSNGRVLMAGGWNGTAAIATAELYNPATNTWSATGSMHVGRFAHSATARTDSRVLVAGGTNGSIGLRGAEVYTPATGTWVITTDMISARENDDICCKQAVLLASGKILVAGGFNGGVLNTAEIYNPTTGTWAATGSMRVGREGGFSLIRLANNKVLAVGGLDDYGPLKYAELYNEASGTWTRVNDMQAARFAPSVVLLASGRVLVTGGSGPGLTALRTSERFTPAP